MAFIPVRLLFAWMPQSVVAEYLSRCSPADRANREAILARWQEASHRSVQLSDEEPGLDATIRVNEPDESLAGRIREVASSPAFRNTFRNTTAEIVMVEIDKLVTYQAELYLDYVDKLCAQLPDAFTGDALFDACFPPGADAPAISEERGADGSITFSAASTNFSLLEILSHPIPESDSLRKLSSNVPSRALSLVIGTPLPYVTVVRGGSKMILSNGLHKLVALRRKGVHYAPAVAIAQPQNYPVFYRYNIEGVMAKKRSPLVKDFFDPGLAIDFSVRPFRKNLRIRVVSEEFESFDDVAPQDASSRETDYNALATAVVRAQMRVLGPDLALKEARRVSRLAVGNDGQVSGSSKESLAELVKAFERVEGGFAVINAKKAIAPMVKDGDELPDSLRERA